MATTVRFIGPEQPRILHIAVTSYRIFPVADTAGTITYEDYSYGFDETDPTAVKKLSDDWTTFPGGQPWQRQAQSPCRYCNPTENAEDWFLKPGYVFKGGGAPVDACVRVLPFNMPANIPKPMAYYFMDEGHGRNLKESVTQASDAGQVLYVADDGPADAAEARADVIAWAAGSSSDDDDDNDYSDETGTAAADVAATAAAEGFSHDAAFAAGRAAADALHEGRSAE